MASANLKTKTDCLGTLKVLLQIYVLGNIVHRREFVPDRVWNAVRNDNVAFPLIVPQPEGTQLNYPLIDIAQSMLDEMKRKELVGHLAACMRRAIIAECYEAVKTYCINSKQDEKFTKLPWYHFPRLLRHLTSHGDAGYFKWDDRLTAKGITKVTWRHRTLDVSMVGTQIQMTDPEIVLLLTDLISFVEKDLN